MQLLTLHGIILATAVGIHLNEFNDIKDLEVMTFRRSLLENCELFVREREKDDASILHYSYPPDVANDATLPHNIEVILKGNQHFYLFSTLFSTIFS